MEVNFELEFDWIVVVGYRLDIVVGMFVWFELGDKKIVMLVEIGGYKVIRGGNRIVNGVVEEMRKNFDEIVKWLLDMGFVYML